MFCLAQPFYSIILSLAVFLWSSVAAPSPNPRSHVHDSHNVNTAISDFIPSSKYGIAGGIDLRILPLGASLVIGHGSSDSNSFREKLRNLMPGNRVTYIGSKQAGNMTNNACECWSGFPIGPLIDVAQNSLPLKPNVVIVIGGTNDLLHDMNVKQAPNVMGHLIDNLTATLPDATLIVGTVPPFTNPFIDYKRPPFNEGLKPVIEKRQREGKRVLLADPAVPPELIVADQIHPNDVGYQMYADKFFVSLVEAGLRGWITPVEEDEASKKHGTTGGLSREIKTIGEATARFVDKPHANAWFVPGLLLSAAALWILIKALRSSRLRPRFYHDKLGM